MYLLKGHGNEADFPRFLHKSVQHWSLTLHLEPFRFWLRIRGDIRNRKTTLQLGESAIECENSSLRSVGLVPIFRKYKYSIYVQCINSITLPCTIQTWTSKNMLMTFSRLTLLTHHIGVFVSEIFKDCCRLRLARFLSASWLRGPPAPSIYNKQGRVQPSQPSLVASSTVPLNGPHGVMIRRSYSSSARPPPPPLGRRVQNLFSN